jgi:hypothetical protein
MMDLLSHGDDPWMISLVLIEPADCLFVSMDDLAFDDNNPGFFVQVERHS